MMKKNRFLWGWIILSAALFACNLPVANLPVANLPVAATPSETPLPVNSPAPSETAPPSATLTPSETPTLSPSETPTETPSPSVTASLTFTPIPTYVKLRGKVIINQAVCHYGPGAPYLYKYGVYKDSNLEILSVDEMGIYIEVQAIGGNNPCWVKAEYMDIKGSLSDLKPVYAETDVLLPMSPYYGPLTGVSAQRSGDDVTISWNALVLRAGDDSEQSPYLVEAWVCQEGRLIFSPQGSYYTALTIRDEAGCEQESHARVYGVEKHGYTRWVAVPWPLHP